MYDVTHSLHLSYDFIKTYISSMFTSNVLLRVISVVLYARPLSLQTGGRVYTWRQETRVSIDAVSMEAETSGVSPVELIREDVDASYDVVLHP